MPTKGKLLIASPQRIFRPSYVPVVEHLADITGYYAQNLRQIYLPFEAISHKMCA